MIDWSKPGYRVHRHGVSGANRVPLIIEEKRCEVCGDVIARGSEYVRGPRGLFNVHASCVGRAGEVKPTRHCPDCGTPMVCPGCDDTVIVVPA